MDSYYFYLLLTITVYEYMFKRNDLPDFLDEFEEQCTNDEKVCVSVCSIYIVARVRI